MSSRANVLTLCRIEPVPNARLPAHVNDTGRSVIEIFENYQQALANAGFEVLPRC